MKKLLLSGVAAAAILSAPAMAADMPVKAPPPASMFNWTGFYVGANGGYGWSAHGNQLNDPLFGTNTGMSPSGGFGGGQMGYNWQAVGSPWVFGLETDLEGSGIKGSHTAGAVPTVFSSQADWFGTLRGRLGYAVDRTLIYATGGLAYGHINNRSVGGIAGGPFIEDHTTTGYVIGGGVEYAFNPAWSVKLEYQYLNFGKNDPLGATGVRFSTFGTVNDDAYHTVRIGLNYRFGSTDWGKAPVVAKY